MHPRPNRNHFREAIAITAVLLMGLAVFDVVKQITGGGYWWVAALINGGLGFFVGYRLG